MSRIKAKASTHRIRKLIAAERSQWEYLGTVPDPTRGLFYFCDKRRGPGYRRGYPTEEQARRQIEIGIAFYVLASLGVENAHEYNWHLWCASAEYMVTEIVQRDQQSRQARAELAGINALIEAMTRKR